MLSRWSGGCWPSPAWIGFLVSAIQGTTTTVPTPRRPHERRGSPYKARWRGPSPQVRWTGLPPGSASPAGRDDGPRQAHSYPDCRTAGATADLGKVTQLVDHPQAVIVPVRVGPGPGQRLGDLALVVEPAHALIRGL